jgi:HAT1-interacting factor 1
MSTFTLEDDPRLKQGRRFMNEKQYEDAISIFSSLLETCVEKDGDCEMSLNTAHAHYEYGNALLTKEEENPSNDVLGNVERPPGQSAEDMGDEEVGEDEDEDEQEGEEEGGDDNEPEGDVQIAWEVLDLARMVFSKNRDAGKVDLLLSDVHTRLGDLMRFNGNSAGAISEYRQALEIRKAICEPHDRMISDVYFSLAVAHIYNSSDKEQEVPVDPLAEKKNALENYQLSRDSIQLRIGMLKSGALKATPSTSSSSDSTSSSSSSSSDSADGGSSSGAADEVKDLEELVDQLQETIDATIQDIKEMESGAPPSSSSSGTTTIGFGTSSSSSSSSSIPSSGPSSTTTIGFGGSSSSSSSSSSGSSNSTSVGFGSSSSDGVTCIGFGSSSSAVPVQMLQIKKKKRPISEVTQ